MPDPSDDQNSFRSIFDPLAARAADERAHALAAAADPSVLPIGSLYWIPEGALSALAFMGSRDRQRIALLSEDSLMLAIMASDPDPGVRRAVEQNRHTHALIRKALSEHSEAALALAMEVYDRVWVEGPEDLPQSAPVGVLTARGYLAEQSDDIDRAFVWHRAAATRGSGEGFRNLGRLARKLGKLDDALAFYSRSIALGTPGSWTDCARVYVDKGDYKEARRLLKLPVQAGDREAIELLSEVNRISPEAGCYVATAVYGSYECPEVWTLRRWRDLALSSTKRGRFAIHLYYKFSPRLVGLLGNKQWFSAVLRPCLDQVVRKLSASGYSSNPYTDAPGPEVDVAG